MSIFDEDQMSMLDVYLYETNSLFEQLDTILMRTEKSNAFTKEDIHSIFRIMHTTKSSSSMMNLQGIATLMHTAEDLFAIFRDHPTKLQGFETETFELLFAISDFMHRQLDHIKSDDYIPDPTTDLINQTQTLLEELNTSQEVDDKTSIEKEAPRISSTGMFVRLTFEKDCRMENIRAYMISTQIKPLCITLEYHPFELEQNPETAQWIQENGFFLHCETKQQQQILEKLHRALFVEKCEIIDRDTYQMSIQKKEKKPSSASMESSTSSLEPSALIPVHVSKLDQLQNLTGELMIAESTMITKMEELGQKELLQQFERSFHKTLLDMEEIVMTARLVPIAQIMPKLNRVVRDIAHKEQKDINFVVKGEDIEIDKEIVDSLFDPLMHLLRNAVDHGIESKEERLSNHKPTKGTIELSIENTNGEIVICVRDDGCGMDIEKIKTKAQEKNLWKPDYPYREEEIFSFILLPGFSTNQKANEFSGRGVGLDVVKNMTDRFKGHVSISSVPQKGTSFTLYLPLTLTIIESLLFRCGNNTFSIPSHHVLHLFAYDEHDPNILMENGHQLYLYKDKVLPILSLHDFFQLESPQATTRTLIYVESSSLEACLIVDSIISYQHIVDKPLPMMIGTEFKKHTGISGCSLLGDGSICMTLNTEYLLNCCLKKR